MHPSITRHLAALRALLVLTVVLGLGYPLALTAAGRLPGLRDPADGSLLTRDGRTVGSALIGQSFTAPDGTALPQYFQSRPSAAGDGYDPTASGASNLGPEDVLDTADRPSLLSQVCARSAAVGAREGVSGARPYCTPVDAAGAPVGTGARVGTGGSVAAVLAVFRRDGLTGPVTAAVSANQPCPAVPFVRSWEGVTVRCAAPGEDLSRAVVVPVRGDAPARPAVPADAVTASASGLDPQISPAYAALQVPRIARERKISADDVRRLVAEHTSGRGLGFLGEPGVAVLQLNLALDDLAPGS